MILFFDLDGPLLDVSARYIALHNELLTPHGIAPMDPARYWSCKRALVAEEDILAELNGAHLAHHYVPRRLDLIETEQYMRHDRCWPWTLACVRHLSEHARLVLVTARARREALIEQLTGFELRRLFHEILSEAGGKHVDRQKAGLITNYLRRHGCEATGNWMIGDTEADVMAGKRVGLQTAAVLSGIRDEAHLRQAEPDFLLNDIRDLPKVLNLPPAPVAH